LWTLALGFQILMSTNLTLWAGKSETGKSETGKSETGKSETGKYSTMSNPKPTTTYKFHYHDDQPRTHTSLVEVIMLVAVEVAAVTPPAEFVTGAET
jgi:hypothetical protein